VTTEFNVQSPENRIYDKERGYRKGPNNMNFLLKNFLVFLLVVFVFVALGQWNHSKFQQKAYDQAKELIMADLAEKGEIPGSFIEPPDFSAEFIQAGIETEDGTKYLYDIGILNPVLVQLSAMNLIISPKVEIVGFIKSRQ
jgi:hypothetical protein